MIYIIEGLHNWDNRLVVLIIPQEFRLVPVIRWHYYAAVIIHLHALIAGSTVTVIDSPIIRTVDHTSRYSARLANGDHQQKELQ